MNSVHSTLISAAAFVLVIATVTPVTHSNYIKADVPTVKLLNSASDDSYMPVLGMGTAWTNASDESLSNFEYGYQQATKWLSVGGRFIDEAYCYPTCNGVAAGVLNYTDHWRLIPRAEFFIQNKMGDCSGEDLGYDAVMAMVAEELALWNTSYFDSLLIHWPIDNGGSGQQLSKDPSCVRYAPGNASFDATRCRQHTWQGMIELYLRGALKSIGVSNYEVNHLQDLMDYRYTDGQVYLPAVNQMQFHGYFHEDALLAYCQQHHIQYNSWATLGTPDLTQAVWNTAATPVLPLHPTARSIGAQYQKSAAQVWLRWQIQMGSIAIPRSNNITHMRDNLNIFDFVLSADDMARLSNVTAPVYPTNLVYTTAIEDPRILP